MLVAANKVDIMEDPELLDRLRIHVAERGCPLYEMSAATHQGTQELMYAAAAELAKLPPILVYEPTYVERPPEIDTSAPLDIVRDDDGTWLVDGPWLRQLMANVNFNDYESRNWFDKRLREAGVFQQLEDMGIKDGDPICLYNLEFEYQR